MRLSGYLGRPRGPGSCCAFRVTPPNPAGPFRGYAESPELETATSGPREAARKAPDNRYLAVRPTRRVESFVPIVKAARRTVFLRPSPDLRTRGEDLDQAGVGDGVPVMVSDLDDDGRRFFLTECRDADDRSADTRTDL
jgi:hypothetical protein